jgi:integrase
MAIRQREWTTSKGKRKTAWIVDYFDAKGTRRLKTFKTRREADDWRSGAKVELRTGIHVADRDSIIVSDAGKLWIADCKADGLEPTSIETYQGYLDNHIAPLIGTKRLNEMTVPAIAAFRSAMLAGGRSHYLADKVITHLGGLIADAQERGLATRNPVRERKRKRRGKAAARHERRFEVGVDIPTPAEIRMILHAAALHPTERYRRGYRRALFVTAAMTGLRISELRGLRWQDVNLTGNGGPGTITVRQRADKWGNIGSPKAAASERTIPVPPMVVNTLREWRLACPRRDTGKVDADDKPVTELHYVFPNGRGHVESQQNIVKRHWHPLQVAAGVSVQALDEDGHPVTETDDDGNQVPVMLPKYSGFHALRHFYCSWCAARREDGGLGLPLKTVQVRMGHSTLAMTADRYGHLFPATDDAEVLAAGERALMGPVAAT